MFRSIKAFTATSDEVLKSRIIMVDSINAESIADLAERTVDGIFFENLKKRRGIFRRHLGNVCMLYLAFDIALQGIGEEDVTDDIGKRLVVLKE